MKYLHVYGQKHEHYSVRIIGNREALLKLLAIIEEALKKSYAVDKDFYCGDGEEYECIIQLNENLDGFPLPYFGEK